MDTYLSLPLNYINLHVYYSRKVNLNCKFGAAIAQCWQHNLPLGAIKFYSNKLAYQDLLCDGHVTIAISYGNSAPGSSS